MLRSKLNDGSLQCYYIYGHLHAGDCGSFWKFINFTLRLRHFLLLTNYFPCQSLKDEETFNIWFPLVLFSSDCISRATANLEHTYACMYTLTHAHTHKSAQKCTKMVILSLSLDILSSCGVEYVSDECLFFLMRKEWEWEIARYPGKGCHKEL